MYLGTQTVFTQFSQLNTVDKPTIILILKQLKSLRHSSVYCQTKYKNSSK